LQSTAVEFPIVLNSHVLRKGATRTPACFVSWDLLLSSLVFTPRWHWPRTKDAWCLTPTGLEEKILVW